MPRQQRNKPAAVGCRCGQSMEHEDRAMTDTYTPVLTDEQILYHGPGQEDATWTYADQLYFGRAIERAAIEGYQRMISLSPETPQQIITALRDLSERMKTVGASMEYHGGFDGRMTARGREMVGAGIVAEAWADSIEREISSDGSDT